MTRDQYNLAMLKTHGKLPKEQKELDPNMTRLVERLVNDRVTELMYDMRKDFVREMREAVGELRLDMMNEIKQLNRNV